MLNEGDVIEVGDLKLDVWHTPGHTPGQLSFKMGNLLFCGDNIYKDSCVGVIDAHHGSNIPDFIESLKRILRRRRRVPAAQPRPGLPPRHRIIQKAIDRLTAVPVHGRLRHLRRGLAAAGRVGGRRDRGPAAEILSRIYPISGGNFGFWSAVARHRFWIFGLLCSRESENPKAVPGQRPKFKMGFATGSRIHGPSSTFHFCFAWSMS